MKKKLRVVAFIATLAMLFSSLYILAFAADYTYEKPVDSGMWTTPKFSTDHAYSIAFVGDVQYITCGDYFTGTKKLNQQFKYIADTAEERKLEHVFVLGDITDMGYWNDANLGGKHISPPNKGEWEIAQEAILQLSDADVSYQICRGNHDDYMIDDYFNVPEYTDQFEDCGGFFSDSEGKHSARREEKNPEGYIYWSAASGYHKDSIVNSWKTAEICGTKYLFITVDYNPTKAVIDWLNDLLPKYPDHKAIITTHSYLNSEGNHISSEKGNTMYPTDYPASKLWTLALRKHANVFMVVSGHVGVTVPFYTVNRGSKGNKVIEVLVDPQSYDSKEIDSKGNIQHGTQDTGLVLYMNFSKDGKTISFDYYSTLLNKFLKGSEYTIKLDDEIDEVGSVDLAGLTDFGQETPLVTKKNTVELDGIISDGEYGYSKVTKKSDIASGNLSSDLTEYYGYDDGYIYYAFKVKSSAQNFKLNLHLGSSLYTVKELNDSYHFDKMTVTIKNGECTIDTGTLASKLRLSRDILYSIVTDADTKENVCEFRIRRGYLSDNNSPDNILSYTLNVNAALHHFALNGDARRYLKDLGVTKNYTWTYNYAYFGGRPEPIVEPPIESEDITSDVDTSNAEETHATNNDIDVVENKGCGAALVPSMLLVITAVASTLVLRKREDNE